MVDKVFKPVCIIDSDSSISILQETETSLYKHLPSQSAVCQCVNVNFYNILYYGIMAHLIKNL